MGLLRMYAPPLQLLAAAPGDHHAEGSIAAPSGTRHAGELLAGRVQSLRHGFGRFTKSDDEPGCRDSVG
jgi:hypothetical protein